MSWSYFVSKRKQRRLYVAIVKHTRHCPWRPPLCRLSVAQVEAERVERAKQLHSKWDQAVVLQRHVRGRATRRFIAALPRTAPPPDEGLDPNLLLALAGNGGVGGVGGVGGMGGVGGVAPQQHCNGG